MSDITDIQLAMQKWHEAHSAVMDFFEENNILDDTKFAQWMELRDAEDAARDEVDFIIDEVRDEEVDEDED